jgi:2-polyprenyl-3-methyl-5-hydroxy-6-metoxy-1,4-benzoquinol methylase
MKKYRSNEALSFILNNIDFQTVLDVGCGYGKQSEVFKNNHKIVTSTDIGNFYNGTVVGNYLDLNFEPHDITWVSHVLEHQLNVNTFLKKVRKDTKVGGYTCITVPPAKNEIVGGHVSIWNAGLLLYNLVLAGFNCKNAHIKKYNYNITVIAKADNFILPELKYDSGDINLLKPWLPDFCNEGFNGDIIGWNW